MYTGNETILVTMVTADMNVGIVFVMKRSQLITLINILLLDVDRNVRRP
jgi:hypothetical protein